MGNPATAHCKRVGGRPFVRNTPEGEAGFCRLRNGRVVDEWKLFREADARRKPARTRSKLIGTPNPAAVYCEEQGGYIKPRATPEGETGECHLPGGRVVDEWTFFREGNR